MEVRLALTDNQWRLIEAALPGRTRWAGIEAARSITEDAIINLGGAALGGTPQAAGWIGGTEEPGAVHQSWHRAMPSVPR